MISQRMREQGMTFEEAISKPPRRKGFEYMGHVYTMKELSAKFHKSARTLSDRINRQHLSIEEAIRRP